MLADRFNATVHPSYCPSLVINTRPTTWKLVYIQYYFFLHFCARNCERGNRETHVCLVSLSWPLAFLKQLKELLALDNLITEGTVFMVTTGQQRTMRTIWIVHRTFKGKDKRKQCVRVTAVKLLLVNHQSFYSTYYQPRTHSPHFVVYTEENKFDSFGLRHFIHNFIYIKFIKIGKKVLQMFIFFLFFFCLWKCLQDIQTSRQVKLHGDAKNHTSVKFSDRHSKNNVVHTSTPLWVSGKWCMDS